MLASHPEHTKANPERFFGSPVCFSPATIAPKYTDFREHVVITRHAELASSHRSATRAGPSLADESHG